MKKLLMKGKEIVAVIVLTVMTVCTIAPAAQAAYDYANYTIDNKSHSGRGYNSDGSRYSYTEVSGYQKSNGFPLNIKVAASMGGNGGWKTNKGLGLGVARVSSDPEKSNQSAYHMFGIGEIDLNTKWKQN